MFTIAEQLGHGVVQRDSRIPILEEIRNNSKRQVKKRDASDSQRRHDHEIWSKDRWRSSIPNRGAFFLAHWRDRIEAAAGIVSNEIWMPMEQLIVNTFEEFFASILLEECFVDGGSC